MTWLIIAAVWIVGAVVTWSMLRTAGEADRIIAEMDGIDDYTVWRDDLGHEHLIQVFPQISESSPAEPAPAPRRPLASEAGSAAETEPAPHPDH